LHGFFPVIEAIPRDQKRHYGIVAKTVARRTLSGTRVRAGRGLGARAASVTPLRVFIPGMHEPILFLALALSFGCRRGFDFINGLVFKLSANVN